jgi:cytoskeleton protein RodZ
MGELGQLLREARERKGVSLEEVEATTKIRQKYLIALEEGDYEKLPPGVYVRGFLRSLAAYLDLEAQELIAFYSQEVPREAIPSPTTFLSQPLTRSPLVTPDLLVGIVLFLAIGVLGAWVFRQYILPLAQVTPTPTPTAEIPASSPAELTVEVPTVEATVESPTPQPTAEATVTSPPPTSTATPIPSPTDTPRSTPTSPPTRTPRPEVTPSSQGITLQVAITQRSWLRIVADGQAAFEGVLERDANRTWRGQEEIVIRCGNAGGVLVTVNGESQGVLGGPGEVVVRGWRLAGDRVVVTTPELPTPTTPP